MSEKTLPALAPQSGSIYANIEAFNDAEQIAKALSSAGLVPEVYKKNIPNTMIALEMAARIGVSPIQVMQNLDVIKGKPSWRSSFIIAALNSCGRFTPIRFHFEGDEKTEEYGCRAVAKDYKTGDEIKGPLVTMKMVKAEGWYDKLGSKWQTMPELMFQYRAAAFFGRLHAPDILNGMHSAEETIDIAHVVVPNPEETEVDEIGAVFNFIKAAKTVEALETISVGDLKTDELKELFKSKRKELKANESKKD